MTRSRRAMNSVNYFLGRMIVMKKAIVIAVGILFGTAALVGAVLFVLNQLGMVGKKIELSSFYYKLGKNREVIEDSPAYSD